MWISKKKWNCMEKRIADLEKRVQAQPKEIVNEFAKQLNAQMTKSSRSRHPWKQKSLFFVEVLIYPYIYVCYLKRDTNKAIREIAVRISHFNFGGNQHEEIP